MTAEATMRGFEKDRIADALIRVNLIRARLADDPVTLDLLDGALEALFSPSRHLIVYGSLAPGGPNHRLLDDLAGEWRRGWITGELIEQGWSAAMSFPALRWCPEGSRVPAHLLVSDGLPAHWSRLDDFEGLEYDRILAPFQDRDGRMFVGYVYAMECEPGG